VWGGFPAQPMGDLLRETVAIRNLVGSKKKKGDRNG
jgi:hypothetical protein